MSDEKTLHEAMTDLQDTMLADPIAGRHLFTREIGGVRYLLRRRSALSIMNLQGVKQVLGAIRGAQVVQDDPASVDKAAANGAFGDLGDIVGDTLQAHMVVPALCPDDEPTIPGQTYHLADLGNDSLELFVAIMGGGDELDPTQVSSEEPTGETR